MVKNFHVIYTVGKTIYQDTVRFNSIADCEEWLKEIGASFWEIGAWTIDIEKRAKALDEAHRAATSGHDKQG